MLKLKHWVKHRVWHTDPWPDLTRPRSLTRWPVARRPGSISAFRFTTAGDKDTDLTSQNGTANPGITTKNLFTNTTTQLPSTLHQNADSEHQSLLVIAGNSFSLQCSSAVDALFRWRYCPFGSRGWEIVYNGAKIADKFNQTVRMTVC